MLGVILLVTQSFYLGVEVLEFFGSHPHLVLDLSALFVHLLFAQVVLLLLNLLLFLTDLLLLLDFSKLPLQNTQVPGAFI